MGGLVGIQLLISFGYLLMVDSLESNGVIQGGTGIFSSTFMLITMILCFSLLIIGTCCCQPMLRKSPHNLIFLFVFTALFSHLISTVAFRYDMKTLLSAAGATSILVCCTAGLVAFTKIDFSKMLMWIIPISLGWVLVLLFMSILGLSMDKMVYAGIGTTIFTIWLAVDLKMMMGGGRYQYSEDDFVMASLNIYLDIVQIFLYMLNFFDN